MTDIAALGLKVEGIQELERLLAAMEKLEKQQEQTEKSQDGLNEKQKQSKKPLEDSKKATEELTEAERKLAEQARKAGMSVNELKNNLRGLPAQFTDIAVSLQGGQAPLTVFLQQGGQLKDMFNGAGNAARAMGGYITGLINPFSLAATAVAALGVAYYQGSKEADAFRVSLATTGNAIGTTTDALTIYSRQIAEAGETQGKAAESLNVFVAAGFKSEEQLAQFTRTAIAWERATGEGVDSVAEKFVALEKDPLKAAMKLQESMNFLTVDIYKQIKALEDQGDKLGAAALAMGAYDSAMKKSTQTILENMGYLEYSAHVVARGFKGMWDMVAGIGRPTPESDKLAKAYEELNDLVLAGAESHPIQAGRVEALRSEIAVLEANAKATRDKTEAEKQNSIALKELDEFNKEYGKYLKEELTLNQALAKAREGAAKQKLSEAETTKLLNGITEEYNKKNKTRVTSTKAIENSYRTLAERAAEYVKSLELEAQQGEKISKSQQLEIELKSLIIRGKGKGTDATIASTKALIAEAKAMETQAKARKAMAEAAEQYQKDLDDLAEYKKKEDEAVAKQAKATEEAGKALENESRMLELQTGLIGASTQARELAIEKLRIQIELEKELDALDNDKALPSDKREAAKAAARERAVQRGANAEKKILIDTYDEVNKYIEDGLYDAIITGGASAGEALERMFKNLVLQPIVKAGVQDLMNLVGMGGGGQGGGAFSNLLSTGKSIYEAVTGQNSMLNSIGNWIGIGGSAASSSLYSLTASGAAAASSAAATGGSIYSLASGGSLGLGASGVGLSAPTTGYFAGSSAAGGASTGSLGGISAAWPAAIVAGMVASAKLFEQGYSAKNFDTGQKIGDIGNYFQTSALAPVLGEKLANILTGAPLAQYIWKGASKALGIGGGTSDYGAAAQYAGGELAASGKQFTKQELTESYAEGLQPIVDSLAVTVGSSLDSFSALFGKGVGYRVQTGFTSDNDDPSRGNFIVEKDGETLEKWLSKRSGEFGRRVTGQNYAKDAEEGYDDYLKAVTAATIPLFREIVPTWADTMLDEFSSAVGFSGDGNDWKSITGTGADTSAALNAVLVQIAQVEAAFTSIGRAMSEFAAITDGTKTALLSTFGSIEGVVAVTSAYYTDFYSEQERYEHRLAEMTDSLRALGSSIDPNIGDHAKEQFRAAVNGAIELGQDQLVAELLKLADPLSDIVDSAQKAVDAAADAAKETANAAAAAAEASKAAMEAAAQSQINATATAWGNFGAAAGLAAQYNGNTSGLSSQLGILRESYAGSDDTSSRVAALQQIIGLEQSLWQKESEQLRAKEVEQNAFEQARIDAIKHAAEAEMNLERERIDAAREQLSSAKSLLSAAKSLGDYVDSLLISEAGGLSEAGRLSLSSIAYKNLYNSANSGNVDALSNVQGAASDYLGLRSGTSSSSVEYAIAAGGVAAELDKLSSNQESAANNAIANAERQILASEKSVELAQKTADAAVFQSSFAEPSFAVSQATQKLIDTLLKESAIAFGKEASYSQKLIDSGLMTVEALESLPDELAGAIGRSLIPAIQDIATTIYVNRGVDGSHATGLAVVPRDGYIAELHKGEAVVPAQYNPFNGGSMGMMGADVANLLMQIISDNRAQFGGLIRTVAPVTRIVQRWDNDGLPEKREVNA